MKIQKFNENIKNNKYIFRIWVTTSENNGKPYETAGSYSSYKKALNEIYDWINNGFRKDIEIQDAYIVKITKEILNNDNIKSVIASKKYNL